MCRRIVTLAVVSVVWGMLCVNGKESKNVEKFAKNFEKGLSRNEKKVFKTDGLTAEDTAQKFSTMIYEFGKSTDEYEADLISKLINRGIRNNFDTLPRHSFLKTHSISAGAILQAIGEFEDSSKVKQLSDNYTQVFSDTIQSEYDPEVPESKIKTMVDAFGMFFQKLNLFKKENLPVLGVLFTDALYGR